MQTTASYNVFSVVLVFSIIGLGLILISDLVVANLLMYSLPGMILLYLAAPFLHHRCFGWDIITFVRISILLQHKSQTQIINSQMKWFSTNKQLVTMDSSVISESIFWWKPWRLWMDFVHVIIWRTDFSSRFRWTSLISYIQLQYSACVYIDNNEM